MTDPDSIRQDSASQDSASQDSANQDQGQPLVDHLIELRTRLLHAILSVLIIFLPLFYVANDIYAYISEPLRQFLPEGTSMIATDVASPFLTPFKLSLVLSIFVAMPYILHQIWSFIAPG
ncbi:MAG: hypothetical protein HON77_12405, partial [Gammaproteobacteria bacterium]|nr:hypothetical protein [Gammaproteobacteria bacterium]